MKRRKKQPRPAAPAASIQDQISTVSSFVRERRKGNSLSQRQLADLASVTQAYLSQLESGKPTLRMDVVNRVLAVFGKQLGVVDAPREKLEGEP
ncbi:MAG: helix-turn-helix domain-containing protein [Myxococcaceae bacterium]